MKFIILILLISFVSTIYTFTRDFRSVVVSFPRVNDENIIISFDSIAQSLLTTYEEICDHLGCLPNNKDGISLLSSYVDNFIDNKLTHEINNISFNYWNDITNPLFTKSKISSDDSTKDNLLIKQMDIYNLKLGKLDVKSNCDNNNSKECLLTNIIKEFNLHTINAASNKSKLILNKEEHERVFDVLVSWNYAGVSLFNNLEYEYAEAFGHYVIKLLLLIDSPLLFNVKNYYYEISLVAYKLLSEASKEIGRFEVSSHFSTRVIYSLSSKDLSIIHDKQVHQWRLKSLLTVPSIPLSMKESIYWREIMINDLNLFYNDLLTRDVQSYQISIHNLTKEISSTPFHISHQGLNDKELQIILYKIYYAICPELFYLSSHLRKNDVSIDNNNNHKIIKIGILSSHFNNHSVGKMMVELIHFIHFAHINYKNEDIKFELFIYYLDKTIPFSITIEEINNLSFPFDAVTNYVMSIVGKNFQRLPENLLLVRHHLEKNALDVLIYSDIGMDFITYMLAISRLATYQVVWWGHPITSGIDSIDYYFGLDIEVINANEHYSEQLVRMEYMNTAPMKKMVQFEMNEGSKEETETWNSIGVPVNSKICLILGRLFKIHPLFNEALVDILLKTSENVYIVVISEKISYWNNIIYDRLYELMNDKLNIININNNNVNNDIITQNLMKRLIFVNFNLYTIVLNLATIVLDTFPYGGCLTTHDALSYSIPMVTLPLEHVRGRYTLGMYAQMEYGALIAGNSSVYVDIVKKLLEDKEFHNNQVKIIQYKYKNKLHKNNLVAIEWLDFITRLFI